MSMYSVLTRKQKLRVRISPGARVLLAYKYPSKSADIFFIGYSTTILDTILSRAQATLSTRTSAFAVSLAQEKNVMTKIWQKMAAQTSPIASAEYVLSFPLASTPSRFSSALVSP